VATRKDLSPRPDTLAGWLDAAPRGTSFEAVCEAYQNPEWDRPGDWLNHGLDDFAEGDR